MSYNSYFAPVRGLVSTDANNGRRDLDADPSRVHARRIVLDSAHHDPSAAAAAGCHFDAHFPTMRNVSGIRVVEAVVPRYIGPMRKAVLTATVNSTKYHLFAFAPATCTLTQLGDIFRAHLEEDARQAVAGVNFQSPWFNALTIKSTKSGFVVMEYYSDVANDVTDVQLDLTNFEILKSQTTTEYSNGFVQNLFGSEEPPQAGTSKGFWLFSQQVVTVHPEYGCPYLCIDGLGDGSDVPLSGQGSMRRQPGVNLSGDGTGARATVEVAEGVVSSIEIDPGSTETARFSGASKSALRNESVVINGQMLTRRTIALTVTDSQHTVAAMARGIIKSGDTSHDIETIEVLDGGVGYMGYDAQVILDNSPERQNPADLVLEGAYVVRVSRRGIRRINITAAGSGYVQAATVSVSGVAQSLTTHDIQGGNQEHDIVSKPAEVGGVPYDNQDGRVTSIRVFNGGSGYINPTVTIVGTATVAAAAEAVVANGSIVEIRITNPGAGYTSPPSVHITDATSNSVVDATTHLTWGYPLVTGLVPIQDAGEGYSLPSQLLTPRDAIAIFTENHDVEKPMLCVRNTTKWYNTPISGISRLRVSARTPFGELYPLQAGRTVIILDVYCSNE